VTTRSVRTLPTRLDEHDIYVDISAFEEAAS
jgi:hypothetical protein